MTARSKSGVGKYIMVQYSDPYPPPLIHTLAPPSHPSKIKIGRHFMKIFFFFLGFMVKGTIIHYFQQCIMIA